MSIAKIVAALVERGEEDLANEILTIATDYDRIGDYFDTADLNLDKWERRFGSKLSPESRKELKNARKWLSDPPRTASPKLTRDAIESLMITLKKNSPEYKFLEGIHKDLWKL